MSRSLFALMTLCGALGLSAAGMASAAPAAASPAAAASMPPGAARVIVKFKAGSSRLAAKASAGSPSPERAKALSARMGMSLQAGMEIAERMQLVRARGMTSRQLAQKLSQDPDVEYAVEDQRRYRTDVPNDKLYGINQTAPDVTAGQWYLRPPSSDMPSAINAQDAWNVTAGSPSVVVAVLDSGVRYDHADLGANLLPGYDMVADVPTANDGDGLDADASDPGDWVTEAEAFTNGGDFAGCTVESSSWHGTQTAGIIAAGTNNTIGMASVGRNVKVLPLRVLGKCGGLDSDIIAAMRWAVGLKVGDLPLNPNPAKVLNLSLGAGGLCTTPYRNAIAEVNATGALIFASAGNSAGHSVSTPANCPGIIAIGGLRHVGTKVGFSDVGPEIALSAPAGNCVSPPGQPCQYPILTTTDSGTTTPNVGSSTYTGSGANASLGTSFSAPLAAATAALVWSAQPMLTREEVLSLLVSSARPFPTSGAGTDVVDPTTSVPICHASNGVDQLECYCTTTTCGAGMLDAAAATSLATTSVYGRITSTPTPAMPAQAVQLSAETSLKAVDRSIASYQWTLVDGGGIVTGFSDRTDAAITSVTPTGFGRFTVSLTVADNTGVQSTVSRTIVVGETTPAATGTSNAPIAAETGGGGGGAVDPGWLLALAAAVALLAVADRRRAVPRSRAASRN